MKTLFTFILTIFLLSAAYGQAGSLDSLFSNNGKRTAQLRTYPSGGKAVAIDHNGRIVVAGDYYHNDNSDFAVCRFRKDGSLDRTFGGTGKAGLDIFSPSSGYYVYTHAVAVQANNKVIVAGDDGGGSFGTWYVARINVYGLLDRSFGGGYGYTIFSFGGSLRAAAVQEDGKIVLAGWGQPDRKNDQFIVIRLNTDGTYDSSFGTNGRAYIRFNTVDNNTNDRAYAMAIRPDGKIVVAGQSYGYDLDNTRFAVACLLKNGKLDTAGFGKGGKVTTKMGPRDYAYATGVAFQPDGNILISGTYRNENNLPAWAVARYLSNGSLDVSYGNKGRAYLNLKGLPYQFTTSMALQPNGKAVIGGYMTSGDFISNAQFVLASVTAAGKLDAGFGSGGIVNLQFDTSATQHCEAYGVAVQDDGNIVVAGSSYDGSTKFAVARLIGEGNLLTTTDSIIGRELITSKAIDNRPAAVQTNHSSLKAYPNPVVNDATIVFAATGKYTLRLSDMTGRTLMVKSGFANERVNTVLINMSRYAAGKYVVVLTDEKQRQQTFELSKE